MLAFGTRELPTSPVNVASCARRVKNCSLVFLLNLRTNMTSLLLNMMRTCLRQCFSPALEKVDAWLVFVNFRFPEALALMFECHHPFLRFYHQA